MGYLNINTANDENKSFLIYFILTIILLIFCLVICIIFTSILIASNKDIIAPKTATLPSIPVIIPLPNPSNTLIPTITPQDTSTNTITLTSTPTWSLLPSQPPQPTLTLVFPNIHNSYYDLNDWNENIASYNINLLESYPGSIPANQVNLNGYYQAYYPAALAYGEAIIRSSATPDIYWQLGLANNLARVGHPQAGIIYARAIAQALNNHIINMDQLVLWLERYPSDQEFKLTTIKPPKNYSSAYILQISGKGSAFIMLTEDAGNFSSESLISRLDYTYPAKSQIMFYDFTKDGIDEVILWEMPSENKTDFRHPDVFDISQNPPRNLPFKPIDQFNINLDYQGEWQAVIYPDGNTGLLFQSTVFPACPTIINRAYKWDGEWFDLINTNYKVNPASNLEGYCDLIIYHAAETWGINASTQIMEQLLPKWPPSSLPDRQQPPLDARDELVYRLGVNSALTGDQDSARGYFEELSTENAGSLSHWIEPASNFLQTYTVQTDIYRACINSPICDHRIALKNLIKTLNINDQAKIIASLASYGVFIRASGRYDFDGDGNKETWFTIAPRSTNPNDFNGRYSSKVTCPTPRATSESVVTAVYVTPDKTRIALSTPRPSFENSCYLEILTPTYPTSNTKLEFWILVPTNTSIESLFISTIISNSPSINEYPSIETLPVINLNDETTFRLQQLDGNQEPYIQYLPLDYFWNGYVKDVLQVAVSDIIVFNSPQKAYEELISLSKQKDFFCLDNNSQCAQYFTLLGLSSELIRNKEFAVSNYLRTWRKYPYSPYTIYTRIKLSLTTLTPTISLSNTQTPTP